jgi:hypothetical protein
VKVDHARRTRFLIREWVLAGVVLLAIVITVQFQTGAWTSGYGAYPDEPSHFVGGLLVRDYLAKPMGSPLAFAKNYYIHQPYFAIGYWPPLFYGLEGLWMLLFGHTRISLMILSGSIAFTFALVLFAFLRQTVGMLWALPSAALFLLLPIVRWSTSVVMTDLAVGLICLLTILALGRFFDTLSPGWAATAGILAGAGILTKYLAAFAILPPILLVLIDRRWELFRRREAWILPLSFILTCGPWIWWANDFVSVGFDGVVRDPLPSRIATVGHLIYAEFGLVISAVAGFSLIWALVRWSGLSATVRLLALLPICAASFLIFAPTHIEGRYFVPFFSAWLALIPFCFRSVLPGVWTPTVFIAYVTFFAFTHVGSFAPLPDRQLRQIALNLVGSASGPPASILVPSSVEGAMIAELAAVLPLRPSMVMVRPSKLFARVNWLGTQYELLTPNVSALQGLLDTLPINIILVADSRSGDPPHDALLRQMLHGNPSWLLRDTYPSTHASSIAVYERTPPSDIPISKLLTTIRARLPRLQN